MPITSPSAPTSWGTNGKRLDQDHDGNCGEPLDDVFETTFTLDTIGPRIVRLQPAGDNAGTVEGVDVWFSEPVNPATFTREDISITGPDGEIAPSNLTEIGNGVFRIGFAAQTTLGEYSVSIGPNVEDAIGNLMDQDRDNIQGETEGDTHRSSFNLVDVDLTLSNAALDASELWAGEPVGVSWDGRQR